MDTINFLLIAFLLALPGYLRGAKVAMFSIYGSRSQKEMYYGIAEALTARGHEVTFYTAFTAHRKIQGLEEVQLEDMATGLENDIFDETGPTDLSEMFDTWYDMLPVVCEALLSNKHLLQLANSEEKVYDISLVDILSIDCVLPVAEHVSKYLIQISTSELVGDLRWQMNIPLPFAISTSWGNELYRVPKLNFIQRLQNTITHIQNIYKVTTKAVPGMDGAVQKVTPGLKTINEVRNRVALVLVNWNPATGEIGATADLVKNIAGVHLKDEQEKIPKDLEEFINGSGDAGFIYISFGTVVPENKMPKHAKKALVEAISKIPQRVVWKFREEIPGLSSNVKLVSWAPQQTLLAHPKIRAFITHAGLFSTIETINFGVPCIGFPVFADQPINMQKMIREGMGIEMIWREVDTQKVLNAMNTIVNNPSYKENAVRLQKIFTDRLVSPKDEAAYWVEYVIRHNGSTHLRIRTDHLNLFQYLLLDVFAFVLAIVLVAFYVTYRVIRIFLCRGRKKQIKSNKKNQ